MNNRLKLLNCFWNVIKYFIKSSSDIGMKPDAVFKNVDLALLRDPPRSRWDLYGSFSTSD